MKIFKQTKGKQENKSVTSKFELAITSAVTADFLA